MRCYNCNKSFDYEKYYGICPKCGCYNKKVSAEEEHQQYHDTYDGGYQHTESYTDAGNHRGTPEYVQETAQERAVRKKGGGLLAASILFMLISLIACMILPLIGTNRTPDQTMADDGSLAITEYAVGQSFTLQKVTLKVTEYRQLSASGALADMEPGKKLIAVRVEGISDGEYEDYNRLTEPYLDVNGHFFRPVSSYDFEPYARLYGLMPLLGTSDLMLEAACDGWYVFVAEEDAAAVQICFEDCIFDGWEKEELTGVAAVILELSAVTEGGNTDEAQ